MKKLFLVLTIAFASALFAQDGRIPTPPGPTPVPTPTPEEVDPLLDNSICLDMLVQGVVKAGKDPDNYEFRLIGSTMDETLRATWNTYCVTNLATKTKIDVTVSVMFTTHDSSKDPKHI